MNEMQLIEDFCAEQAAPGPERLARSRARLVVAIAGGEQPGLKSRGRPRASRLIPVGAAAAVAAGALVIAGVVSGGTPATPGASQAPGGLTGGQPAQAFLLAVAAKAAQQPGGRYYCTTEIQGNRELAGQGSRLLPQPWADGPAHVPTSAPKGFAYALISRYEINQCIQVSDVTREPAAAQNLGTRPASAADDQAWHRAGSPRHWGSGQAALSADPGPVTVMNDVKHGSGDFGGKNDLWLPTDPAKLRAVFLAHPQPGATGRDNIIVAGALAVMGSDNVLPAVRAAAYQVLAAVPGMRMKPGVTDPEGQTGTAIWRDSWIGYGLSYETTYDIIDPQTGGILAGDTVAQTPVAGAPAGTVLFYSATTSAFWTNHLAAGGLPPHAP